MIRTILQLIVIAVIIGSASSCRTAELSDIDNGDPFVSAGKNPFATSYEAFEETEKWTLDDKPFKLKLENARLLDAIQIVCLHTGWLARFENHAVILHNPFQTSPEETRVYSPKEAIAPSLASMTSQQWKRFLVASYPPMMDAKVTFHYKRNLVIISSAWWHLNYLEALSDAKNVLVTQHAEREEMELRTKAASIQLSIDRFGTAHDHIEYLKQESRKLDPDGEGINIFIQQQKPTRHPTQRGAAAAASEPRR